MKHTILLAAMLAVSVPAYAQIGGLTQGLKRAQQAKDAKDKFDEKTLELKDEPTRNIVKQQLEAFAKFIDRVGGKK